MTDNLATILESEMDSTLGRLPPNERRSCGFETHVWHWIKRVHELTAKYPLPY